MTNALAYAASRLVQSVLGGGSVFALHVRSDIGGYDTFIVALPKYLIFP